MLFFQEKGSLLSRDLLGSLLWLLMLALVNHKSNFPIYSIFPYLIPVVILTWRWGILWGFGISAFASLAAIPGGYVPPSSQAFLAAGMITYVKLSLGACATLYVHKKLVER